PATSRERSCRPPVARAVDEGMSLPVPRWTRRSCPRLPAATHSAVPTPEPPRASNARVREARGGGCYRAGPTERCSLDDLTVSCLDARLQRLECAAGVEVGAEDPDGHLGQPGEPFDGRH